jgi:tyrosine-protein kinase Etk/Wzc
MDERLSLTGLIYKLARNRKVIIVSTLGAILISAAVSLLLPKWYRATASILPPESASGQADIGGMMRFAGYQPAFIPTITSPSEIYVAVLESNRIMDAVVDSFDLMTVYKAKNSEDARGYLRRHAKASVTADGIVRIACEDKSRTRAAQMANTFVRELDRFNRTSRSASVRNVRRFIETRLEQTVAELGSAEEELQRFKEQTGAVLISEQTRTSIETAAGIYGQIAGLEVNLERLGQFATEKSPEIIDIRTRIRAMERKLAEMGYMESASEEGMDSKLFPKFSNAPELERQLAELLREVEIKRTVYAVLSEQYEQARIQEMKNTPTIMVLDWAQEPITRWRPKRTRLVAVTAVCALLLSSLIVLARERINTDSGSPEREALSKISMMLSGDIRRLLSLFGHVRPRTDD